jgi:hypothetical protein
MASNAMNVAVFGPHGSGVTDALMAGLDQLRHKAIHQNASAWVEGQASPDEFDAVFLPGLRGNYGAVARYYSGHDVPVYSLDAPHLRTIGEQFRVERLFSKTSLPEFDGLPNEDRLEKHGLHIRSKARTKNNYILFCGQTRTDASHGLGHVGYEEFVKAALATVRSLSDSEVYWRPHPKDPFLAPGFDGTLLPAESSLDDSLAKAWLVVTHSSGSGIEALVAGVPVLVFGHPIYEDLAYTTQTWKDIAPPKPEAVKGLVTQLAYTQWSLGEIASGTPLKHVMHGTPFPGAVPPTKKSAPEKPEKPETKEPEVPVKPEAAPPAEVPKPEVPEKPVEKPVVVPEPVITKGKVS